jgi:hypothetical protein
MMTETRGGKPIGLISCLIPGAIFGLLLIVNMWLGGIYGFLNASFQPRPSEQFLSGFWVVLLAMVGFSLLVGFVASVVGVVFGFLGFVRKRSGFGLLGIVLNSLVLYYLARGLKVLARFEI